MAEARWFAKVAWAGLVMGVTIFLGLVGLGPSVFVTNTKFNDHLEWSNRQMLEITSRLTALEEKARENVNKIDHIDVQLDKLESKLDEIRDRIK